jgi:5'-3' exonuclease
MGVKDLINLLKSKCPHVFHGYATKPVEGNFWVDTPLIVMAAVKKAENTRENPIQVAKASIQRVFKQIKGISEKTKVFWVFDGGAREEKKETCIQRSKNAEVYNKRCFDNRVKIIQTGFEIDSCIESDLEMASAIVSELEPQITLKQVYDEIKEFCLRFGEVYIAKHDSEEYIGKNMEENDIAVSSDSDALPFGCVTIVQHFGSEKETWIYLEEVLEALQMKMETFQELCVLLGTDFNPRLKGCGPVKCYTCIKQPHFSIEQFANENGGTELWLEQAFLALKVFQAKA